MDFLNTLHAEFQELTPRLARRWNIFKAPGQSRANQQQGRNTAVAGGAMPIYNDYASFLKGMTPEMQQAYGHIFNMATNPNYAAAVAAMHSAMPLNAMAAQRGAMSMYGNGALAQGAGINAMNKGMDMANQFGAQQYNPQSIMGNMGAGLSAMQTPLNNMTQLAGTIYGQPQVPVGKSGLDYLAQAAGMYAGSKTGGAGGGGLSNGQMSQVGTNIAGTY